MEDIDFCHELAALPDLGYWYSELREIRRELGENRCDAVAMFAKKSWLKKICYSSYPLHSDERFQKCKLNIEQKYGNEVWLKIFNVSKTIKKVLSTNQSSNIPSSLSLMAIRSVTAQGWLRDDKFSQLLKYV